MADSKSAAAELLRVRDEDGVQVDALNRAAAAMRREGDVVPSFFEGFALRGIRVAAVHPGRILCTFTVPARLTTANHQLAPGAVVQAPQGLRRHVRLLGRPRRRRVRGHPPHLRQDAGPQGLLLGNVRAHRQRRHGAEGRHSLFGKLKAAPPTSIIKSNI